MRNRIWRIERRGLQGNRESGLPDRLRQAEALGLSLERAQAASSFQEAGLSMASPFAILFRVKHFRRRGVCDLSFLSLSLSLSLGAFLKRFVGRF